MKAVRRGAGDPASVAGGKVDKPLRGSRERNIPCGALPVVAHAIWEDNTTVAKAEETYRQ